jgi:hypothetical protein
VFIWDLSGGVTEAEKRMERSVVVAGLPGGANVAVQVSAEETLSGARLLALLVARRPALAALSDTFCFSARGRLWRAHDVLPSHVLRVDLRLSLQAGKGGFGALLRGGSQTFLSIFFFFFFFFFLFFLPFFFFFVGQVLAA